MKPSIGVCAVLSGTCGKFRKALTLFLHPGTFHISESESELAGPLCLYHLMVRSVAPPPSPLFFFLPLGRVAGTCSGVLSCHRKSTYVSLCRALFSQVAFARRLGPLRDVEEVRSTLITYLIPTTHLVPCLFSLP